LAKNGRHRFAETRAQQVVSLEYSTGFAQRRIESERKSHTELNTLGSFGCDRLSHGRGGQNRVYCCDVGVVEKVSASCVEGERTGMILIFQVKREGATQVRIEMNGARHCSNIPRHIAVQGIGGKQAELGGVDARTGRGSIGRAVVEVAIAVVVGSGGNRITGTVSSIKLGVQHDFSRQIQIARKRKVIVLRPFEAPCLALLAVTRLGAIEAVPDNIGFEVLVRIAKREAEAFVFVLIEIERNQIPGQMPRVLVLKNVLIGAMGRGASRAAIKSGATPMLSATMGAFMLKMRRLSQSAPLKKLSAACQP
jgi:hypothetical protein